MKISKPIQPVLNISLDQILYIFLKEKYMADPSIFGLKSFSANELVRNLFEMTGDDFYCLYEKSYSLAGLNSYVNVKNYFSGNEFISNGIDISNARICTEISHFSKRYGSSIPINSVELLLDDSLNYGSLIINKFLDVRFGKLRNSKSKKKFHLIGISTDYELPSDSTDGEINTHGARIMKKKFSFHHALKKFKNNSAIKELVTCVIKNFPHAVSADD